MGDLAEQPASPFDEARAVADSILYEGLSSMAASRGERGVAGESANLRAAERLPIHPPVRRGVARCRRLASSRTRWSVDRGPGWLEGRDVRCGGGVGGSAAADPIPRAASSTGPGCSATAGSCSPRRRRFERSRRSAPAGRRLRFDDSRFASTRPCSGGSRHRSKRNLYRRLALRISP